MEVPPEFGDAAASQDKTPLREQSELLCCDLMTPLLLGATPLASSAAAL